MLKCMEILVLKCRYVDVKVDSDDKGEVVIVDDEEV